MLSMGGAETWLMEVLRLWSASGAGEMDFLLTNGTRGVFDDEAARLGAQLHYLPYTRRGARRFATGFRRLLRDGQYDAIHDHQDYSAGWHLLMGLGVLPERRIVHVHNPSFGIRDTYGITPARRLTARTGKALVGMLATQLTGTSRQILTEWGFDAPMYRALPKGALHCGFSTSRFLGDHATAKASLCDAAGWPRAAKVLLIAGRIDASPDLGHPKNHKNSGFALDVALACMRRDPLMRAFFAGERSAALPVLESRVRAAGRAGHVLFAGVRDDVHRLMVGADALLFPSRGEGLGMVVVEAQAAGLPVFASDVVPRECVVVPELVSFHPVAEGADAWAERVLARVGGRRDIAEANRRLSVSPFNVVHSAQALEVLYRSGKIPGMTNGAKR